MGLDAKGKVGFWTEEKKIGRRVRGSIVDGGYDYDGDGVDWGENEHEKGNCEGEDGAEEQD
ncbi:hypothetical protein PMIN06_006383 [Paraphaeosphaeria minitans]